MKFLTFNTFCFEVAEIKFERRIKRDDNAFELKLGKYENSTILKATLLQYTVSPS